MINEQELSEAVERLREGDDNGLLVKHEEVLSLMLDESFGPDLLVALFECEDANALFESKFNSIASNLLREAYRTKLEREAGL